MRQHNSAVREGAKKPFLVPVGQSHHYMPGADTCRDIYRVTKVFSTLFLNPGQSHNSQIYGLDADFIYVKPLQTDTQLDINSMERKQPLIPHQNGRMDPTGSCRSLF